MKRKSLFILVLIITFILVIAGFFLNQLFNLKNHVSFIFEGTAEENEWIKYRIDDFNVDEDHIVIALKYSIINDSIYRLNNIEQHINWDFLNQNGIGCFATESIVDGVLSLNKGLSYSYVNYYVLDKDVAYKYYYFEDVVFEIQFTILEKSFTVPVKSIKPIINQEQSGDGSKPLKRLPSD